MKAKILSWLIAALYRWSYEPITLDKINQKLVRPVPGLIIDGVQYFEFVNLSDMPRNRLVHYNYMREEMVMGIDRELQMNIVNKILEANAEKDHNRIAALGFMYKDILANITSIEALYNVASVVYFDLKEDVSTYDFDYSQQKISRFKSLKNKDFFFSHLLQQSLKLSAESLPKDIQQFLNENAVKLNAWMSIISEPTESKS